MTLRQVEQAMGVATPAREGRVFRTRYTGLEIKRTEKGGEILTEFITPVGTISQLDVKTDTLEGYADSGLPKEHPIKRVEDYARDGIHHRAHLPSTRPTTSTWPTNGRSATTATRW